MDRRRNLRRGARGGAQPFDPSQVAGLVLDLDGDKGLTTSNVNRLYDATPNAHTATQDTSSKRPSLVENDPDFNGHNSLSFDGVGDFLTSPDSADFELGTGLTIYVVAKAPLQSALHVLVDKRNTGATSQSWSLYTDTSGSLKFSTRNAANTANYVKGTGTVDFDDTVRVYRGRHAAGGSTGVRVDSSAEVTAAAGDEVASSASSLNIATNNASGSGLLSGKVARILIYKESIADGSTADLAIMAELDALYKGVGSSTGLLFEGQGNLVADFNPDTGAGLATTAWADQSGGTAHDAAQATTTRQPAYTASDASFNGHGSVVFDGTDDVLVIPDDAELRANTGITVYMVQEFTATAGTDSLMYKATNEWAIDTTTTGQMDGYVRNAANTAWVHVAASGDASGAVNALRLMWDGSTLYTRHDATEATIAAPDARSSTNPVYVGSGNTSTLASITTIARILIYSRAVTAAEDARIMAYLNALYHIGYSGFTNGFTNGFG